MTRYWIEIVLPLYSLTAVFVYFRPGTLPDQFDQSFVNGVASWLLWGLIGALTGMLAISALFLMFYLLYSPFYLASQVAHVFGPKRWVDGSERRFYLWCFLLLCLLIGVGVMNPTAAAVSFTILAGSAQLLWKFLV